MSLSVATSIIAASLRTTEVASAVAAANVANAGTAGYTRKTVSRQATDTAVGYATIDIASITSTVNQFLLKTLVGAQSGLGYSKTMSGYLDQFQQSLGTTSAGSTLGTAIDSLADVLGTLATSPESASAKSAVLSRLTDMAGTLRETSSQVQALRGQADSAIATTVDGINTTLTTIGDLNDQIVRGKALGQNTANLEDQRNEAVKSLSGTIGVRYQVDSNGMMRVSTDSGIALVDSAVHTLSYKPAASVSADTVYSATGPSGFQGIMVGGRDITTSVGSSGKLGALIDLRDTVLPQRQDTLDNLATTLKDTLNDISNAGTSAPPPNSLTGSRTVSGTDALSGSGTLRIAVTGADGKAVEVLDLDLGAYATVQDAVDAIDAMDNLSASISPEGKLVIRADNAANGVALGGDTAVGAAGKGFSAAFGLNDLFTGTGAADLQVNAALAKDSSRLPTSALSTDAALAPGDVAVSAGNGKTAQALSDAFTKAAPFGSAGDLPARNATFAAYAGNIVQAAAGAADKASTTYDSQKTYADSLDSTLSSQSGVNVNEEAAAASQLQSAYQAAAAVMKALEEMFQSAVSMVS